MSVTDQFNQIGVGRLPGLLGIVIMHVGPTEIRAELPVHASLMAPNGFLHAASIIALADTAAGYATRAHLPAGATSFTTIEMKSNFFGTQTEGVLLCEATAVHTGRNTQVWDAEVTGGGCGKRLALFRCTQMILWPKGL